MLKTAIASREQVLICIDALDEASPEHRVDLLDALREVSRESPSIRIFLTGRPFVRSDVERYFPGVQVISVSPTTDDIKAYLTMTVNDNVDPPVVVDVIGCCCYRTTRRLGT
ncbi:hypothetical protein L873DRAFT_1819183 [Choiromyces venosus 120613-1]|uniref:Nephrocystin 3-like N-terminal domain-containing protein n=1 Tax=Choiromyces venosus 120613-1 TaxID=1336337 RepID=A0A3N4J362_9PEZI|nr:hypothetical protein L873DRAFT_1819183 [Choiromyces venosus 120613-1]